jgi:PhnB protein
MSRWRNDGASIFYNTSRAVFAENGYMANTVKAIPEGFEGATPYLSIKGAADAIEFYKKAFGATESMRIAGPDGRIGHAEIKIGKANIMLADEHPEIGFLSPRTLGGSPVMIHIYVEDVDALAAQAEAAGAKVKKAVSDQFYGDRVCQFEDPFGHGWHFATHKEDVSNEEMRKRAAASV